MMNATLSIQTSQGMKAPPSWFPAPAFDVEVEAAARFSVRPTLCSPRRPRVPSLSPEGTLGSKCIAPAYWPAQHAAWAELCRIQLELIPGRVAPIYMDGLSRLALERKRIPTLAEIDAQIHRVSGWRVVRVDGYVPPAVFFNMLA